MPVGLAAPDFDQAVAAMLLEQAEAGKRIEVIRAAGRPIALVAIAPKGAWHLVGILWFPWATAKQKLGAVLTYLGSPARPERLIMEAKSADWRFYDRLCEYGALRRVGILKGYGAEDVAFYQTVEQ